MWSGVWGRVGVGVGNCREQGPGRLSRGSCSVWLSPGSGPEPQRCAGAPSACAQVAVPFPPPSCMSSFRFSAASFICC